MLSLRDVDPLLFILLLVQAIAFVRTGTHPQLAYLLGTLALFMISVMSRFADRTRQFTPFWACAAILAVLVVVTLVTWLG